MNVAAPRTECLEFHTKKAPFALIIGVWNEGEKFTRQIDALQSYRSLVDIVIADGASTDGASSKEALQSKIRTLLVNRDEQRGLSVQYRAALAYGLEQGYEGFVMMDGNGKDGADAIPRFIEKLKEGYDFVQGSRFLPGGRHENTPLDRVLGIRYVFNPIMSVACGYRYTDAMNGFKAVSRHFLLHPRVQPFRPVFVRYNLQYYCNYIAPRIGVRICEIPVSRIYLKMEEPHSKIVGLRARLKILKELWNTVSGRYNVS